MFGRSKLVARIAALEKERDDWRAVAEQQLEIAHKHVAEVEKQKELARRMWQRMDQALDMMAAYDRNLPGWREPKMDKVH
jgi:hypothetical protein